jgi:4-nitrophenyl phosphatase
MRDIEAACQVIWAGAKLYVASDLPFFATKQGRTMGYSYAIVGAIRRMTKASPILTGKPSLHALRFVARQFTAGRHVRQPLRKHLLYAAAHVIRDRSRT